MNKPNFYYTKSFYLPSLYYPLLCSETDVLRWSCEKPFLKYAANVQENTHAEVGFQ